MKNTSAASEFFFDASVDATAASFENRKIQEVCRTEASKGIEPTNNTAERALRPALIYRKLSFGTQSDSVSRFIERILTVSETCKLQKRSPFQFLVASMTAYFAKQKPPSLVPKQASKSKRKVA